MEIKEIYIKNFRNIGEEGAEIKLSPVTIFTGCNSAGKSTAAKALLLLEAYLSDVKANNFDLISTPLDFSKIAKLGTFDSVLNKTSKSNGVEEIMLGYSFVSSIMMEDFQVYLYFGKKNTDTLSNGYLNRLSICLNTKELLSIRILNGAYHFTIADNETFIEYIRFYKIRHFLYSWKRYEDACKAEKLTGQKRYSNKNSSSDEEWEKIRPLIPELLSLEERLISEQFISSESKTFNSYSTFNQKPTIEDIISAIEDIIELEPEWVDSIDWERENNQRFSKDTASIFMEKINGKLDSVNKQSGYAHHFFAERIDKFAWDLQTYIDSDAKNIIEYKKGLNNSILDDFINFVNLKENQSEFSFSEREKKIGILNIINDAKEFKSNWIGRVLEYILEKSLTPNICGKIGYVDSSTVDVRRQYPLDYSDRFGNLWKRFNDMQTRLQLGYNDVVERGSFMKKWLQEFDICDNLIVDNIEGALLIKLITKDNPEGRLLADFGYGVTQLVALLLNIEIAINSVIPKPNINEEGELMIDYLPYLLIIEEPEVHLHPSLQSRFADMFLDATRHGVHFIIETHSEYLVRRTQVIVASLFSKNPKYKPKFRVYYFPENNAPYDMGFQKNGKFIENFGTGFFDVADNSAMDLFEFEGE